MARHIGCYKHAFAGLLVKRLVGQHKYFTAALKFLFLWGSRAPRKSQDYSLPGRSQFVKVDFLYTGHGSLFYSAEPIGDL